MTITRNTGIVAFKLYIRLSVLLTSIQRKSAVKAAVDSVFLKQLLMRALFGICLGMQMAVVEFARHVCGMAGANSSEFGAEEYAVIDIMEDQKTITEKGGTMRLGLYPCKLAEGSRCREIYGEDLIYERHRHRWEYNNAFRKQLTEAGLSIAGISPDERLVEIVEIKDHPWFVGVQFHPEFKSRPNKPQKLFADFIRASVENQKK